MLPFSQSPRPARSRGFALLITVILLSLLVLVMVSLAALTRVETQVASNSQTLAKARHNALMALGVALGELQRTTGPDQRVTVTADMGTVGDGDALTPDNGLPTATDGTYAWTGVLGNTANPVNPLDPRKAAHTGETPAVLNWLVSGNENTAFTASVAAADFGRITASAPASGTGSIPFGPSSVVTGLSATTRSTDTNLAITPAGGAARQAVLLVGPGSVLNSVTPSEPQANYVVAPLVDINAPDNLVPGLGAGTAATTIGRYAWWVGDEGVKARVNLDDPNKTATTGDNARLRTLVAARTGTEVLTGFGEVNPEATTFASILSDSQLGFLNGVTSVERRARFHDASPFSAGVLANVATGGLKKDLTAGLLGTTQPPEIADSERLFTTPGTTANPTNGTDATSGAGRPFNTLLPAHLTALRTPAWSVTSPNSTIAASGPAAWPNWGKVRSHVRTRDQVPDDNAVVSPRVATDTTGAISPVVSRFQIFIVAFAEHNGSNPALRAAYLPAVVLWNPYDVALAASDYGFYYEVDYTQFDSTNTQDSGPIPREWKLTPAQPYVIGSTPNWPSFVAVHSPGGRDDRLVFPGYPANTNISNPQAAEAMTNRGLLSGTKFVSQRIGERKGLRFVIRSPVIPPGEAIVFTPEATRPMADNPRNNIMTPGWRISAWTESFTVGIPGGHYIRYVLGTWPRQLANHQRFYLGLGGDFDTGPAGVDQIPRNLLQAAIDISSDKHSSLDGDRNAHIGRFVDYTDTGGPQIPGVNPLPENGSATWVPPGALLVSNNSGPHTTRFAEWDPSWDGAEIDEILVGNDVPPSTALNFVFRLEPALPHKDVRPAQIGASGAPGSAKHVRWMASLNPFAGRLGRSVVEAPTNSDNPVGAGYAGNPLYPHAGIIDYHGDNFTTHQPSRFRIPTWDADLTRAYIGSSTGRVADPENPAANVESSQRLIARHLPRAANTTLSVGALQHADLHPTTGILQPPAPNLTALVPNGYAASHMPAYAVGNSLVDPLVNAADVDGFPNNWNNITSTNLRSEARWLRTHFDLSLLANRALWDRYYFSGVPLSGPSVDSRNPRLVLHDPERQIANGTAAALDAVRDFDRAAANQMVNGAFNINSTSREAWTALLASTRSAVVPGMNSPADTSPVLRVNGASGDAFDVSIPATGLPRHRIHLSERFRSLTDAQIRALADEIVDEIRARGPALSVAGFVNRRPQADGDPESADFATRRRGFQRYLGPLQTAIDRVRSYDPATGDVATFAGINDNLMREVVLDTDTGNNNSLGQGRAPYSVNFSRVAAGAHREVIADANGVSTTGPAFIIADAPLALRTRAYGMPGYLTQADIFQLIGPVISARSDTFRVRTYGEVKNPYTGETLSRAWLEAVVQRMPEFIDETNSPHTWRDNSTASSALTAPAITDLNARFGRSYRVVSFRWLAPDEV